MTIDSIIGRTGPWAARSHRAAVLGAVAIALAGCARPSVTAGDPCELNTQCAEPLICRLDRCRVECRTWRDCGAGLSCVRDEDGLGACQVASDRECTLSSDCGDFLVCRFGQCTNACNEDRDCPPGAACLVEDEGGGRGCHDMAEMECHINTDCPAPLVCAVDLRCREECRTNRDCRDGQQCLGASPRTCGYADAGVPPPDGSVPGEDGGLDGGTSVDVDAGTPPPLGPPLLAGGLEHTCAAPSPDDLRCWGANDHAQLGAGNTAPLTGLHRLSTLEDVTHVAAGAFHSCVIAAGEIHCWGDNAQGQIGVPSSTDTRAPVSVAVPGTPTDLSCGSTHTCAISGGALYCWGNNVTGQIGVGDESGTDRFSPTEVSGLPGTPAEVATFGDHTCVRQTDGQVACFGDNGFGQLGLDPAEVSESFAPMIVPGLDEVAQIATGTTHTCAIRDDRSVWCWGLDTGGQLGDGTRGDPNQRFAPMAAASLSDARELGLGSSHSCARTGLGVRCWGDGLSGQLGYVPAGFGSEPTPTAVSGLEAAVSVRAGSFHTCAWRGGMDLVCFGQNMSGQVTGTPDAPPDGPTLTPVPWSP